MSDHEEVIERIEAAGSAALEPLKALPADQRDALTARIVGAQLFRDRRGALRAMSPPGGPNIRTTSPSLEPGVHVSA